VNKKKLSDDSGEISHIVYISIGSNIGKPEENCRKGISALKKSDGILLKKTSKFYETEPVDYKDQAWFINAVAEIKTILDPIQLFNCLKLIEKKVGRSENDIRFGPRILDLDIIFFDDVIMETPDLVIPHPRMDERRFVLKPLCDINPDLVHPVLGKTIKKLLENITDKSQRIREYT
jgi:2-amino-4-hydroxy-6-hydroxymethyldihydropteridine diphosphokinase